MAPITRRAFRLVCALLSCLVFAGCATSPQSRLLLADPPDIPPRVELVEVPFYPQEKYHCGPAALAAIVNFRGGEASPNQIADMIYVPELKGSLQAEVVAAARQFDLVPVRTDGQMESLLREVAAGNPVFVLQNLSINLYPFWHYEILIGYDFEERDMILRSGTHRRITRNFAKFEKTWQRGGHWALVLVPPDAVPVTADANAYLDAAIGMEQVGRTAGANQAYATALRYWPDNLLAYSGLGNTAYALGDFAAAESAYRSVLDIDPGNASIWNNLAYALAAQGRRAESLDAVRRALDIDPDNANFAASMTELSGQQ